MNLARLAVLRSDFSPASIAVLVCGASAASYFVSRLQNAVIIDGPDIGYAEDFTHFAGVISAVFGLFALKRLLMALDDLFGASKSLFDSPELNERFCEVQGTIFVRTFIGRVGFFGVFTFFFVAFLYLQVARPLLGFSERSWAQMPYEYSLPFLSAVLGSYLVFVLVLGNAVWYALSTLLFLFRLISRSARDGSAVLHVLDRGRHGNINKLTRIAFTIVLISGTVAIYPVVHLLVFGVTSPVISVLIIYTVVATYCFVVPVTVIANYITVGKERLLEGLSRLFTSQLLALVEGANTSERPSMDVADDQATDTLRKNIALVADLDAIYERISSLSIMSTSLGSILKSILVIGSPLLIAGSQRLMATNLGELIKKVFPWWI